MIASIPLSDRNLILTGYSSPNQLMIVRRAAEKLGMPFVDFEARLEDRADMPLEAIRARYGEARLKTLQSEVVQEIMLYRSAVILISGHTLKTPEYFQRLSETGSILCLVAALDTVLQRLHLALGARYHNPSERAMALGKLKREWEVRKMPGIQEFDTSALSETQIIEAIVAFWREQALVVRG
jgi:shikimate kinase